MTQTPTIHEVLSVRMPRQTWLSPDGNRLAHTETAADWENNTWQHSIIITDLVQRKQTHRMAESVLPQIKWTWDSRFIGYITTHEGRSVLRKVDCEDGSVKDIASSAGHFVDFDWRPGSGLVIAEDPPLPKELDNDLFSVRGELPPCPSLLVINMESGESQRFGGWDRAYFISDLSWSPSGDKVLFTALPEPDIRVQWQHLLMLEPATGELVRLIEGERSVHYPAWDDDGSRIAFFEREVSWDDLYGADLKILGLADRSERLLLPHVELNCRVRSWNKDRILVSGQVLGRCHDIYALSTSAGECLSVTGGDMPLRTGVSASRKGRTISYLAQVKDRFPEVTIECESAPPPVRITDYHTQVQSWPELKQRSLVWQSADGYSIEGVLVDARANCETDSHPLIVLLHGGPGITNLYDCFFHYIMELWSPYPIRQWSEQGISVFMPDYHGSSGYGREFMEAIRGRIGEWEQDDIVRGLDCLLPEYGFDPRRVGVAGISYGGYLTMLLAAKHPSRFAAASVCNGWGNLRMQLHCAAGNMEAFADDDAWDPNKPIGHLHALSYLSADCPPTLLQVGEMDTIVPPGQSEAFYRLARKRGANVRLVTYKDSGHFINHPKQMQAAQEHNLEWFTRWL